MSFHIEFDPAILVLKISERIKTGQTILYMPLSGSGLTVSRIFLSISKDVGIKRRGRHFGAPSKSKIKSEIQVKCIIDGYVQV
jgi:hypothetical protein